MDAGEGWVIMDYGIVGCKAASARVRSFPRIIFRLASRGGKEHRRYRTCCVWVWEGRGKETE